MLGGLIIIISKNMHEITCNVIGPKWHLLRFYPVTVNVAATDMIEKINHAWVFILANLSLMIPADTVVCLNALLNQLCIYMSLRSLTSRELKIFNFAMLDVAYI